MSLGRDTIMRQARIYAAEIVIGSKTADDILGRLAKVMVDALDCCLQGTPFHSDELPILIEDVKGCVGNDESKLSKLSFAIAILLGELSGSIIGLLNEDQIKEEIKEEVIETAMGYEQQNFYDLPEEIKKEELVDAQMGQEADYAPAPKPVEQSKSPPVSISRRLKRQALSVIATKPKRQPKEFSMTKKQISYTHLHSKEKPEHEIKQNRSLIKESSSHPNFERGVGSSHQEPSTSRHFISKVNSNSAGIEGLIYQVCAHCNSRHLDLDEHIKDFHADIWAKEENKCSITGCDFRSTNSQIRRNHELKFIAHKNSGSEEFNSVYLGVACPYCDQKMLRIGHYARHMESHRAMMTSEALIHKCGSCQFRSARLYEMMRHWSEQRDKCICWLIFDYTAAAAAQGKSVAIRRTNINKAAVIDHRVPKFHRYLAVFSMPLDRKANRRRENAAVFTEVEVKEEEPEEDCGEPSTAIQQDFLGQVKKEELEEPIEFTEYYNQPNGLDFTDDFKNEELKDEPIESSMDYGLHHHQDTVKKELEETIESLRDCPGTRGRETIPPSPHFKHSLVNLTGERVCEMGGIVSRPLPGSSSTREPSRRIAARKRTAVEMELQHSFVPEPLPEAVAVVLARKGSNRSVPVKVVATRRPHASIPQVSRDASLKQVAASVRQNATIRQQSSQQETMAGVGDIATNAGSTIHSQQRGLPCPYCPTRWPVGKRFDNHIKTTHPEEFMRDALVCCSCEYRTTHKPSMTSHNSAAHGQHCWPGYYNIVLNDRCPFCTIVLATIGEYKGHMTTHHEAMRSSQARIHACQSCDFKSSRLDNLFSHWATQLKGKDILCSRRMQFDYAAAQVAALSQHAARSAWLKGELSALMGKHRERARGDNGLMMNNMMEDPPTSQKHRADNAALNQLGKGKIGSSKQ